MKTNSKEVKQAVQAYIMSCIDFSNYGKGNTIANCLEAYKSESAPLRRNESIQEHFIYFLNGLPSWLSIEYYNHAILELMASWGLPLPKNKDEQDGIDLYHYLIFREFCALLKKEGLSIY